MSWHVCGQLRPTCLEHSASPSINAPKCRSPLPRDSSIDFAYCGRGSAAGEGDGAGQDKSDHSIVLSIQDCLSLVQG